MDPQWQPYQDPLMGRPAQFNNGLGSNSSQYAAQPAVTQPPMGYQYETFQTPGMPAKAPSIGSNSKPMSMATSPTAPPRNRDYVPDADTTMEDADPYNRAKYSVRTSHYARPSSQYFPTEESTAARRYSPKNALTPSATYSTSPGKSNNPYAFPPGPSNSIRRSPTRGSNYTSPPQAYQSPPCELIAKTSQAAFLEKICKLTHILLRQLHLVPQGSLLCSRLI